MLDIRRMKVLREVAAQGSFSAAAEALNFTQSAVSQHVAALEREAGATLLERGSRGVRLTDAGRALVAHADVILARIDDAEEELAALAGLRGGRKRTRLADLAAEKWIASTPQCGCRGITDRACQDAGFELSVAFEADE